MEGRTQGTGWCCLCRSAPAPCLLLALAPHEALQLMPKLQCACAACTSSWGSEGALYDRPDHPFTSVIAHTHLHAVLKCIAAANSLREQSQMPQVAGSCQI